MRLTVPLALLTILLGTAFSGCMGDAPEPEATTTADASAEPTTAANASVDDGTTEMDADVGHMPHLHDYWMSKDRVTIMDDDVDVDQFNAIFFTFFNTFRGTPGVGGAFFQLPEGALVYEGTGRMEIALSWTDPTITGAGVQYRTPASESFSEVVPAAQGTPIALEISPDMTDMPHDKESRWVFLLVPAQAGQSLVGKIHVKIDIIRVGDITLFPGHPELFHGAHTLTLFDGAATSSTQNFATQFAGFATDNQQESGVRSSKVVPMETQTMTANVTITSANTNIGQVSNVTFLYKPAGSFRMYAAQLTQADIEGGIFQFAWPVDMKETDSPYADTSQWKFDLRIQTDPAGQGWETNGLADAQIDYDLQVVAYDARLEGIEERADGRGP